MRIYIRVNLAKRFQESENEKDVLEWIVDRIVGLLIGYLPENFNITRAIRFDRYELFRPEGGQWAAELQFNLQQTIKALDIVESLPEQIESLEFFGVSKPDFSDPILIKNFK
jgi:hypothetical protein